MQPDVESAQNLEPIDLVLHSANQSRVMVPDALCNYLHCLGSSTGVIDVGVPVPHPFRFPKNNTSSRCCQAPVPAVQRASITGFKDSDGSDELLPRTKGFISRDAPMPNFAWPPTALGRATPRHWQQWQVHPQLPLSLAQLLANQIRRHALTSHHPSRGAFDVDIRNPARTVRASPYAREFLARSMRDLAKMGVPGRVGEPRS